MLSKRVDTDVQFAPAVILTCCILNNITEDSVARFEQSDIRTNTVTPLQQPTQRDSYEITNYGNSVRNAILEHVGQNLPLRRSMWH